MKFLRLTQLDGEPVWINMHTVAVMHASDDDGGAYLSFLAHSVDDPAFHVQETPDEILAKL